MPGMNGFDVPREIRAFSDVPITMLTARDDVIDKVKERELGADDSVTKPSDDLALLARVKALPRRLDLPQPVSRATSSPSAGPATAFRPIHADRRAGCRAQFLSAADGSPASPAALALGAGARRSFVS